MRFPGGIREFVDEVRDPKPRLKPGVTYFRLIVLLLAAGVLSVVGLDIATTPSPPVDDCTAKGIDSNDLKEGTCTEGDATLVVVDRHTTLKLETLDAKLLTVRYRKIAAAPGAADEAGERLVTFGLSIENLTDHPAPVSAGSIVLNAGKPRSEDVRFERHREPHSFGAHGRDISPWHTVEGTVTFRVPAFVARAVRKGGNLDILNLGEAISPGEPKSIFSRPEYGVIRTYH